MRAFPATMTRFSGSDSSELPMDELEIDPATSWIARAILEYAGNRVSSIKHRRWNVQFPEDC